MANRLDRKVFVEVYARTRNGTKAAIAAGAAERSAHVTASRLLKDDKVLSCVRARQEELAKEACISEEYVLLQLLKMYQACAEARPAKAWDYEKHEMVESGEKAFDSKGAIRALELIGQHLGMFKGKGMTSGAEQREDDPLTKALKEVAKELHDGNLT